MAKTTIKWTRSPGHLAIAIEKYGDKVGDAIEELGKDLARDMEAQMKQDAPWKDQTGRARKELKGACERAAKEIVIVYLSHGVDYGVYLELSNAQQFATIQPTMQRMFPEIMRRMATIFK
jgi:hypothetical protein